MKNLNKLQKIYSGVNVLLKLSISISAVAAVLSLAGVIWILIGFATPLGDNLFAMFISNTQNLSNRQIICKLLIAFVQCICMFIMFKATMVHVKTEIAASTPFDTKAAQQLTRAGLTIIITACVSSVVTALIYGVLGGFPLAALNGESTAVKAILIGVILLFISLIYSCGVDSLKTQQNSLENID